LSTYRRCCCQYCCEDRCVIAQNVRFLHQERRYRLALKYIQAEAKLFIMPNDNNQELGIWRELIRTYGFAIVMFALAIVPVLNFTYSGHGGISWLLVPLCFPYVILRALINITTGSDSSRRWYKRFFFVTIPLYVVLALPLSWAATTSIRSSFGLPVSTWSFFGIMVSPFPWWYFK
jgi:hypothetical protein